MDSFSYANLDALVEDCCRFYRKQLNSKDEGFSERRRDLAKWVKRFHEDCGTLTDRVKESTEILAQNSCVFLMTAHQPNLFAYGGVLRKPVLNHAVARRVAEKLKVPVVSFFGVADQDFTDDRWVRCAVLPDVERKGGVLELRTNLPEKMMLHRAGKVSHEVLDRWRREIGNWLLRNLAVVERGFDSANSDFTRDTFVGNFERFWSIVEEAYAKAVRHSDFNAFVTSKIVNEAWGLPTLFARFSECQQIFGQEFAVLISRFDEYSRFVREAISSADGNLGSGIYDNEFVTVPFWFHCDCGSKARLIMQEVQSSPIGVGECLKCEKIHQISFGERGRADVSELLDRVSARSIAMPLVFFQGLGVCCYVGGQGGRQYLLQAKYVANRMFGEFPVVAIWRPHDNYLGVSQCAALLTYMNLSGKRDFSEFDAVIKSFMEKIVSVQRQIDEIEEKKQQLIKEVRKDQAVIEELKALSNQQAEIRRSNDYTSLTRGLRLLENVQVVMHLHPCVADYAVNVGLKSTGENWIRFLEEHGDLNKDLSLSTPLGKALVDKGEAASYE